MVKVSVAPQRGEGEEPTIPASSMLAARLSNIEEVEYVSPSGEVVPQFQWEFKVIEPPYVGEDIRGRTTQRFTNHPNCKAYQWAMALAGREFADGEEVDLDDLVGAKGTVFVEHKTAGTGRIYANVTQVLRINEVKAAEEMF